MRSRVLWHYLRARRRVGARGFADRVALERHQQRLLADVLRRAPGRYPFYADLAAGGPLRLMDLPVLDKPDVLANFAALNARGLELEQCLAAARGAELGRDFSTRLGGLSVGLSSGTSGQQTAFLTSAAERDRWAGEVLARALPRGLLAGARVTLVLRASGPLYETVDGGRVSFAFVDLALPAERLVAAVVASQPSSLVAPPSVLRLVADAGIGTPAGAMRPPERVFSVAEVLDPHDAAAIEAGLGVRVDQVYQAAEGFLGMSCHRGTLHLAEDLVLVERERLGDGGTGGAGGTSTGAASAGTETAAGGSGTAVGTGAAAESGTEADARFVPIVTDLVRSSQAVLRRRLGDILVPGTCGCGDVRVPIRHIIGRSDDVLKFARIADPGTLGSFYPDFVRVAILAVPGVNDFRVVQRRDGSLALAVLPQTSFPAVRQALADALTHSGLIAPMIVPEAFRERDPLSKVRRVRRE